VGGLYDVYKVFALKKRLGWIGLLWIYILSCLPACGSMEIEEVHLKGVASHYDGGCISR
jgi:hypothetical protein